MTRLLSLQSIAVFGAFAFFPSRVHLLAIKKSLSGIFFYHKGIFSFFMYLEMMLESRALISNTEEVKNPKKTWTTFLNEP